MDKKHTAQSEFTVDQAKVLPQVDIVYAYSNMNVDVINTLVASGAKGLVIAGVGDGNMTQQAIDLLGKKAGEGIVVVRSTRLPKGLVLRNNEVDDDKLGFVASGELNPPKSRVLLQLALMKTQDPKRVQTLFEEY